MVKIATPEMIPQIKNLWQLGFGDDMEYIDYVFDNLVTPEKVMVYLDKTKTPVAMLCMEPFELISTGCIDPAMYVYAFTTHPRFRNRGIGAVLLEGLHKYLTAKGFSASVLKPADDDLFEYYGNNDYEKCFNIKQFSVDPDFLVPSGRNCILVPRSLENLYRMRNSFFGGSGLYARWTPSYLHFVGEETRSKRGGGVLLTHCGNEEGYIVYRKENNEVHITEFAVPENCIDDVLYTLHQRENAGMYHLRLREDYDGIDSSRVLPFAMIKWYDKQVANTEYIYPPYINHVMD